MNKDEKLIAEKYETVVEFAFPTRGASFNSDYEIAEAIATNAERIKGLANQRRLTNASKPLQQLLIDISNFAERLDGFRNSPDRV